MRSCAERRAPVAWVWSRNMPPTVLGSNDDPSRHAKAAHLKAGTTDIERPIPVAAVAPASSHFVGTSWTARVPERQCLGRFTATQQRGHSIYPTLEVRRLALGKPFENQATSRVWSQVFTQLRNLAWRKGCRTPFFAKVFRKNVLRKKIVRWGFRKGLSQESYRVPGKISSWPLPSTCLVDRLRVGLRKIGTREGPPHCEALCSVKHFPLWSNCIYSELQ